MDFGEPPSNLSVRVAVSPTVTVSRSSVAVKLAARRTAGTDQSSRTSKANRSRSPVWLRLRGLNLIHDDTLRIDLLIRLVLPGGVVRCKFHLGSAP